MSTSHTVSASRIAREIASDLRQNSDRWWPGFRAGGRGPIARCLGAHIDQRGGGPDVLKVFGFDSEGAVMAWNDRKDITVADVIDLCDEVAALSDDHWGPQ